jgi:hypothetical protein
MPFRMEAFSKMTISMMTVSIMHNAGAYMSEAPFSAPL